MRILSFSERWDKLNNPVLFTTFRYPRRDRDWEPEEVVQVYFKARSPAREKLGIARIISIDEKTMATNKRWSHYPSPNFPNTADMIAPWEAEEDGFTGMHGGGDIAAMVRFIKDYGRGDIVNKLTLYWIDKDNGQS